MPSDNVRTLAASFATREAADRAVEHLVQQHGLNRADIFIEPEGDANSAGEEVSGGDAGRPGSGRADDAALEGRLRVSVDLELSDLEAVRGTLREAGGTDMDEH